MKKAKSMKKKKRVKQVDDFSSNDRGQTKAMELDDGNRKLAKFANKKARAT